MWGLRRVTEANAYEINSNIGKTSGCGWRKRSIFWDLPYWSTNLIGHNLDVMHIENVFNTVMNIKRKIKDNIKAKEYLAMFCFRKELEKKVVTPHFPGVR